MPSVISVNNLGKRYRIGTSRASAVSGKSRAWDWIVAPYRNLRSLKNLTNFDSSQENLIWALRHASFTVDEGEVVGVIGGNGAGKSTLLKLLSRITSPTEGEATLHGRVGSLLEVGTGFHPEMTGRENTYLSGTILGMRKREIDRKFDEIVDFSGIEKFIDTPVKRYSSGMYVRLAFAIAAHLEPEILLVDEVLAVGDAAFQKKCIGKMGDVAKEGRTVLFVSHNMGAISSLCSRAIMLENGKIACDGTVENAVSRYLGMVQGESKVDLSLRKDREGNGAVKWVTIWTENSQGERIDTILSGEEIRIVAQYEALPSTTGELSVAFALKSPYGVTLSDLGSEMAGFKFSVPPKKGRVVCTLKRLPLNTGSYVFNVYATINGMLADWVQNAGAFTVEAGDYYGTGKLPSKATEHFLFDMEWEIKSIE